MKGVSIKNFTRHTGVPRLACEAIAREILPSWDVSLVFVGPTRAKALNKKMRGKTYVPNVLSYRMDSNITRPKKKDVAVPDEALAKSGEIIICISEVVKQAPAYGMSTKTFILFLFIHGALHLKGWAHSARMEKCERKLLARFASSHETENSDRHRHRHVPSKGRRR